MATYKGTKGFTVQILADDPTSEDTVGLLFFNSTDNEFKYVRPGGISAGTWASGGNINTARQQNAGCGIQTAGLCVGGESGPPPFAARAFSEEYNGSSWTEGNDLNTARAFLTVLGLQTAALAVGGYDPSAGLGVVESYN